MTSGPPIQSDLMHVEQCANDKELRAFWQQAAATHANLYRQYQSPNWWDHLCSTDQRTALRLFRASAGGTTIGVVPIQAMMGRISVAPVSTERAKLPIRCVEVLGSQPLLPVNEAVVAAMLETIFDRMPEVDGVYFKSIPQTCPWFDLLPLIANQSKRWLTLIAREEPFHSLSLPDKFDDFLARFSKKKRYNLKRQVRLMEEAYNGQMRLECITQPAQIEPFLAAAEAVATGSWKDDQLTQALVRTPANIATYSDLANRGLLRSYVLRNADQAVAYALGYQFDTTYHYADIAYSGSEVNLSPGTVLLCLIVRDLVETSRLRMLNFGIGNADYKRQFGDQHTIDRSLWVLRPTFRNQAICATYWSAARVLKAISTLRQMRSGIQPAQDADRDSE